MSEFLGNAKEISVLVSHISEKLFILFEERFDFDSLAIDFQSMLSISPGSLFQIYLSKS